MLQAEELNRIQRSSLHLLDAFPHDFAGQHTGVRLTTRPVKASEAAPLIGTDGRIRRNQVRGLIDPGAPEGFVIPPNLPPSRKASDSTLISELCFEHIPELP